MAEPSRKRRRGNSAVRVVDLINEVATLRAEVKRVKNDNECLANDNKSLFNDNKRLANENTGLQADISEMKKLDTIRSREMWDFKKEKEDLAKRVSDRDIDVYEQVNIIEELQGKLKVYETEREGRPPGENANTSGTNAPEQSQPILNEEIATATIQADSPSQAEPFSGKESPDDHVADAAETAPQLPTRMGVRLLTS